MNLLPSNGETLSDVTQDQGPLQNKSVHASDGTGSLALNSKAEYNMSNEEKTIKTSEKKGRFTVVKHIKTVDDVSAQSMSLTNKDTQSQQFSDEVAFQTERSVNEDGDGRSKNGGGSEAGSHATQDQVLIEILTH